MNTIHCSSILEILSPSSWKRGNEYSKNSLVLQIFECIGKLELTYARNNFIMHWNSCISRVFIVYSLPRVHELGDKISNIFEQCILFIV